MSSCRAIPGLDCAGLPRLSPITKYAALGVMLVIGAGVAHRLWFSSDVKLQGKLREGSHSCTDECHFSFVLEVGGGTEVLADTCIMPDTLRDWPGRPVELMVAGKPDGKRRVRATFLATKQGYRDGLKPSSGRPASCFVPPARR
jgi:hypothetical protein